MTKRQEIREGITNQQRLRGAFADKILICHKMTRDEALWEALAYMRYLHSQGVVIKVEKKINGNLTNELFDAMGVIEEADCKLLIKQALNKAGYEAIVPLIEEE